MKKVFLDLEGTVIDDALSCNVLLVHWPHIKNFIDAWQPDEVETFSWAFWEARDFDCWPGLSQWLLTNLGRQVKLQEFDVAEQRLAFLRSVIGHIREEEVLDFGCFANKERVFEWFIRRDFKEGHFVLIDDMVPSKKIILRDLIIELINVADLG